MNRNKVFFNLRRAVMGLFLIPTVAFNINVNNAYTADINYSVQSPAAVFSNPATITIGDANEAGTPGVGSLYPSEITVSGLGTITDVNVTLNGVSHVFPDDIDILLVSPSGKKLILQGDAGSNPNEGANNPISNVTYSFDQAAAAQIPNTALITAGNFKPGNYGGNDAAVDVFPAPAPAAPYLNPGTQTGGTPGNLDSFNGDPASGVWRLYVTDDDNLDTGEIAGGWNLEITAAVLAPTNSRADFDGDGKTDYSVFRNGDWFVARSTGGFAGANWGAGGDFLTPGDFNGDNKTDFSIYRDTGPGPSTDFYVVTSETNTLIGASWGTTGDIPKIGDFDGDNKDDLVVYRASNNSWFILPTNGNAPNTISFDTAQTGDIPLVMDYDGDGRTDLVLRNGNAWRIRLANGLTQFVNWGIASDRAVQADYDNDNRDDVAVFRNGQWFVLPSNGSAPLTFGFGQAGDIPTPGDYDGDGDDDIAVYRSGTWFVRTPSNGFTTVQFGINGDRPIPIAYIQE